MIKYQHNHSIRNALDTYITPYSLVQQLIDNYEIDKDASILEPCSSIEGTIVKVLKQNGFSNIKENVYDPGIPDTCIYQQPFNCCDIIITNTPYGKEIITLVKQMKLLAKKQVIALYPISTLHSTKRWQQLWSIDDNYQLSRVLMFVRPPFLKDTIQEDGKYDTGCNTYGWFIWTNGYTGNPVLQLIDNTEFCNRKAKDCK